MGGGGHSHSQLSTAKYCSITTTLNYILAHDLQSDLKGETLKNDTLRETWPSQLKYTKWQKNF